MTARLVLRRTAACTHGWRGRFEKPYPVDHYTGAHFCERDKGHGGRCRCACGARTKTKPPPAEEGACRPSA